MSTSSSTTTLYKLLTLIFLMAAVPFVSQAQTSSAPDDAKAYIISPEDGDTVPSTFTVRFGLKGMGIAPAGTNIEGTGHHHLLIDAEELPPLDRPVPATETSIHYGLGQTETELTLSPGEHTLRLILGDFAHIPHDNPVISEEITITVSAPVE